MTPRALPTRVPRILRLRLFRRPQDGHQRDQTGYSEPVNPFVGQTTTSPASVVRRRPCQLWTLVLHLEPFLADGFVAFEFGWRALEYNSAVAHHVDPVRYSHCDRE